MNTNISPTSPTEVFREWQRCLAANDQEGVTVRSHIVATHTCEFLRIPATGRRVEWDHVAIVKIKDGRVAGHVPNQTCGASTRS